MLDRHASLVARGLGNSRAAQALHREITRRRLEQRDSQLETQNATCRAEAERRREPETQASPLSNDGFNPAQPRDSDGRWTSDGGSSTTNHPAQTNMFAPEIAKPVGERSAEIRFAPESARPASANNPNQTNPLASLIARQAAQKSLEDPLRLTGAEVNSDDGDDLDNIPATYGEAHAMLRRSQSDASGNLYDKSHAEMQGVAGVARAAAEMNPVVGVADGTYQAAAGKDAIDPNKHLTPGERWKSAGSAAMAAAPTVIKGGNVVKAVVEADEAAQGIKKAEEASTAVARATKAINLPAWKTITINMAHIAERHIPGGPFTAGRTVFPSYMNEDAVEKAIRQAYRFGEKVFSQDDRVLIQGTYDKIRIEMWVNRTTKTIETAYPIASK